jgi:hypothetical protein
MSQSGDSTAAKDIPDRAAQTCQTKNTADQYSPSPFTLAAWSVDQEGFEMDIRKKADVQTTFCEPVVPLAGQAFQTCCKACWATQLGWGG